MRCLRIQPPCKSHRDLYDTARCPNDFRISITVCTVWCKCVRPQRSRPVFDHQHRGVLVCASLPAVRMPFSPRYSSVRCTRGAHNLERPCRYVDTAEALHPLDGRWYQKCSGRNDRRWTQLIGRANIRRNGIMMDICGRMVILAHRSFCS